MDHNKIAQAFADMVANDNDDQTLFDDAVAGDMRRHRLKYHLSEKEAAALSAIAGAFAEFIVREEPN